MASLAHTLALLAMTMATVAIEEVPLDKAQDSFVDQYLDCGPEMTAALPALNRSDFQKNPLFAWVWVKAMAQWQSQGSPVFPLSSPAQAIAIMAYTMLDLYKEFNAVVRKAGRSPQEYQDNFHYKTLHFLLTQALVHTCHGVDIREFSTYPEEEEVLIPTFEIFKVTNVMGDRKRAWIQLHSNGTSSNYNCGNVLSAPFHLGGLLLATTALEVATRIH